MTVSDADLTIVQTWIDDTHREGFYPPVTEIEAVLSELRASRALLAMNNTVTELEQQAKKLREAIPRVEVEPHELQYWKNRYEAMAGSYNTAQADLRIARDEATTMGTNYETMRKRRDAMEADRDGWKRSAARRQEELDEWKDKCRALDQENAEHQAEIDRLQAENNALTGENMRMANELAEEKDHFSPTWKARYDTAMAACARSERLLETERTKVREMIERYDDLRKLGEEERNELHTVRAELEDLHEKFRKLERDLVNQRVVAGNYKHALDQAEAQLTALRTPQRTGPPVVPSKTLPDTSIPARLNTIETAILGLSNKVDSIVRDLKEGFKP